VTRAILAALGGVIVGAVLALPLWWGESLIEYAELRRYQEKNGVPEEHRIGFGDVMRTTQLVHLATLTAGFGGTIGSVLGATSAILRAVKGPEYPGPEPRNGI
jgi:hypothetical protein